MALLTVKTAKDVTVKPHRKQFVIDRHPHVLYEDWRTLELTGGYVLSYQEDLKVERLQLGGRTVLVLGERLALRHPTTTDELVAQSSGRFIVIDGPAVCLDTLGLLSVYYHQSESGLLCTSSPAIAARLLDLDVRRFDPYWSAKGSGYVMPGSRLVGLKRLFGDQRLDLAAGSIMPGPTPWTVGNDVAAATDSLEDSLMRVIQSATDSHDRILLALSAGKDSRTLFAALLKSGVEFTAATLVVGDVPGEPNLVDVEIAKQLCSKYGVPHIIASPQRRDIELLHSWSEHTWGAYDGADNHVLVPTNQYRFLAPGDIIFRGSCIPDRRHYEKAFRGVGSLESVTPSELSRALVADWADEDEELALEEWLGWRRSNSRGLDLVDAYWADQAVAGWQAAVEQGFDLWPGASVQPTNCAQAVGAVLSGGAAARREYATQRSLMRRVDPGLLEVPFNPKPRTGPFRRRFRRMMWRIGPTSPPWRETGPRS